MKLSFRLWVFLLVVSVFHAKANDTLQINQQVTDEELRIAYQKALDSIENSFQYERGTITLKNNLAVINVPEGFKYMNGKDAEMVLTDLWGNPPSPSSEQSLGMLFPENSSPMRDSSYAINITYTEGGYIDDSDAKKIDYDDLLSSMQEDTEASNPYRIEQGYPAIELVGWANPPFYDSENKKLHWAKELKFDQYPINTLNYSIRVLGRKGFLELNVIGEMFVLDEVKDNINPILTSVNFSEGNKYSDFNPDLDKVAAYGIGGLIAGKILTKAGFLAKIGIFLAKFWKIVALAFVGLFAGIRNFFSSKKQPES